MFIRIGLMRKLISRVVLLSIVIVWVIGMGVLFRLSMVRYMVIVIVMIVVNVMSVWI